MTMARRLSANFGREKPLAGIDVVFSSTLPVGSGMSGSSALMMMTFTALAEVNDLADMPGFRRAIRTPVDLAVYLACAENGQGFRDLAGDRGVGTFGGSEDHAAILNARAGFVSLFGFCPASLQQELAWPRGWGLAIAFSDLYRQSHKMVGIQDFLIHSLTGKYVTDHTFGSRTNLMNLSSRRWDDELLRMFGIERRLLCDLVPPGSVVGGITTGAAAASNLPSGLPVISAGGDQNCAALGHGVFLPGTLIANTGTGSYLIAHADRPVFDSAMRLNCNASAVPAAFIVEATVLTSGSIYRWFTDRFYGASGGSKAVFQQINDESASAPVGANGVILLPYFMGSGSPWWNPRATGSFLNLTLGTTRADMARAVLEGIAAEIRENVGLIEKLTSPVTSVSVSGGLTSLPLFNQIQADMMNKRVFLHHFTEATSVGAWVTAATTLGIHSSLQAAFEAILDERSPEVFSPDPHALAAYTGFAARRREVVQLLESSTFYGS